MEIRLVGEPEIVDDDGVRRPLRGHQSWALLARIVLSDRPLSRRALSAELFPSAQDPLGALRWSLASLRRAIDSPHSFAGDPVTPGLPADTRIDVVDLEAGRFDVERAGELLEGIDPRCGAEFDMWLMIHRQRVAGLVDASIRSAVLHWLSVGESARALELAEVGARRAVLDEGAHVLLVKCLVAVGSHEAAASHVEQTRELFRRELGTEPTSALRDAARPHLADPPPGVSLRAITTSQLESGRAALAAGAIDAGIECLRQAADDAPRTGDDHLVATCLLELGTALVHAVRSHDDEGSLLLQQSADLADRRGDASISCQAHRELGYVDALAGRRPSARDHLAHARTLAEHDDRLLAGVRAVTAFNTADWGRFDDAVAEYELAIDLAHRTENPRREAWALGLGAWAQLRGGHLDAARSWVERCLALTADIRWVAFRPWPLAVLAELRLAADAARPDLHTSRLREDIEQSFALSCSLADPCWEGATARVLALAHAAEGNPTLALDWIAQAGRRCRRETDTWVAMPVAILATDAELSLSVGDAARAEASARALVSLAARTHMDADLTIGLDLLARSGRAR